MEAAELFRLNVRFQLEKQQRSGSELARSAGIQQANISRILSGREAVTLQRAERIADALETPLIALLLPIDHAKSGALGEFQE